MKGRLWSVADIAALLTWKEPRNATVAVPGYDNLGSLVVCQENCSSNTDRPIATMPALLEERQTPPPIEIKPPVTKISYPTAKGFGLTFLVSVALFFAFLLSWPSGATFVSVSFIPALILVNGAMVYRYRRRHLQGAWKYAVGVAIALVLDYIAYLGLLFLLMIIVLGGTPGP